MLERINRNYPDKMVIISEFGTPGVFGRDTKEADELRVRVIREQLAEFGRHDWIGGAIFWCYQDYRSHRNLFPGFTSGYVDHGLVDENRQRRPSYRMWMEENAPARMKLAWTRDKDSNPPTGFRLIVERRGANEIPTYTPRDYRLVWELRDDGNTLVAQGEQTLNVIAGEQTIESKFQTAAQATTATSTMPKSLTLRVRLHRPRGFVAAEQRLEWLPLRVGGEEIDDMRRKGTLTTPLPPAPR